MNVGYNMYMAENDDDMLERDVIANRYSEFYGNAFAKKKMWGSYADGQRFGVWVVVLALLLF